MGTTADKFKSFLSKLGYSAQELSDNSSEDTFTYSLINRLPVSDIEVENIAVKYIYTPDAKSIRDIHLALWNKNELNAFVAVTNDYTYIINAKKKPVLNDPLQQSILIDSFNYGVNSQDFPSDKLKCIKKESIDSSYFFDFVISRQKKTLEVDKDLLINLLALKRDLLQKSNDKTVHLLILRCLFIKYLEDRGVYPKDYLYGILQSHDQNKLLRVFKEIKRINGDIFKDENPQSNDIQLNHLIRLERFFACYDYQSGQMALFPYQFDKIPIQLISNIYESFLKSDDKKAKGIYYTPAFIVRFMLAHTVVAKLKKTADITVFDPCCGSGAFLVESYKAILCSQKKPPSFDEKIRILQNQLFGIDLDEKALQIAAFSLYLALLEGEPPNFIRERIKASKPILPNLIGSTLVKGNALTDNIVFKINSEEKPELLFDCILANPPWGAVPEDKSPENDKMRQAIGSKKKAGTMEIYKNVSDYQRSQAFLLRVNQWSHDNSVLSLIVNNSIFFNENAEDFRKDFLINNKLAYFYELSDVNKILFKKRIIGQIRNENIEIGANEPCAIVVVNRKLSTDNIVKYISPKLNKFSESLKLIQFGQKDIKEVRQTDLMEEDILWRVFVHGEWDDYQLIKAKILKKSNITIQCRSGFQPKKNMRSLGEPIYKKIIQPSDFERYFISHELRVFNWNQKLHRERDKAIFKDKRMLVPVRPLSSDNIRFRGIRTDKNIVHKHNILSIKIKENSAYLKDYAPYLGVLNSSFMGYYLYHVSSQWGKGEAKRSTLRNCDIEELPFPEMIDSDKRVEKLKDLVLEIELAKKNGGLDATELEQEIDEVVFDLYDLLDFEREAIREFYQINVERKNDAVLVSDLQRYVEKFRRVFGFILKEGLELNASYDISNLLGAVVCFKIADKKSSEKRIVQENMDILHIVKKDQLKKAYLFNVLNEDKIRIYDKDNFYIVKSKYFKDWTVRQAIKDANQEIEQIVSELPEE